MLEGKGDFTWSWGAHNMTTLTPSISDVSWLQQQHVVVSVVARKKGKGGLGKSWETVGQGILPLGTACTLS